MSNVVRTWKDATYRQSLSAEEQAMLPENPAGGFELTDAELEAVYGAWGHRDDDDIKINNISAAHDPGDNNCATIGFAAICNGS